MDAESIFATLKLEGYRISKMRRTFIDILLNFKGPISASEILSQLKRKKITVNKTSVYRELEFWLEREILREIDLLDGKKRYELHVPGDHHHHLICNVCKKIACVEMPQDLDQIEKKIAKKNDFLITGHVLEFFGLCKDCRRV